MNDPLSEALRRRGRLIVDGGLATELERRGADLDDPLWSARVLLENPALVRAVHDDYLRAGADVLVTASYQATLPALEARGLSPAEAAGVLRLSVQLALDARDAHGAAHPEAPRPLVAASIGCYGAALHDGSEYRGDYGRSARELADFHRPRMELLARCGADLLACETIPCQVEAEALVRVLDELPDTHAWLTFSCRDGERVCHGERLADCVAVAASSPRVVAVGVNCTAPQWIEPLVHSIAPIAGRPLIVYPNRGDRWDAARHAWTIDPAAPLLADLAPRWVAAGARLVGGCCRTTPDDIRQLAHTLRE